MMFFQIDKDPFRPSDWRWKQARWLRENHKHVQGVDKAVKVVRDYQNAKAKVKNDHELFKVASKYPGLYWAEKIFENNNHIAKWVIEAYLLSGEDIDKVAERVSCSQDAVFWYEKAFYNVRPHLLKKAYIIGTVMGESIYAGLHERDYDLLWKLIGYTFGPLLLDQYVNVMSGSHITEQDQVDSVQNDLIHSLTQKKTVISALTVPTAYNQVSVIELYTRLKELEKASGNAADAHTNITNNIHSAMLALPFTTNPKLASVPELIYYDNQSVELRAHEQIEVALGNDRPELREAVNKLPMESENGDQANK